MISRRGFLERSLLAAASAAVPGSARAAAPRRSGPNDRLRVAVIGVRGQGRVHVNKWSNLGDAEVVALVDPDPNVLGEPARVVEKKTGRKPAVYADLRKMLEDKSVDVVSIATPNHWHVLASFWAVQAGKDVYVEKPLGHSVWEQRKLVEAARKHGRLVQMGNYPRSLGHVRAGIAALHAGRLGKIRLARGLCYNKRTSIGIKPDGPPPPGVDYDLWLGPAPERPFNPNRFHYNWHWNWDFGGGEVANNGIYYLDTARWGLNKNVHPVKATSVGGRLGYEDDAQTPNTQVCLLDYGDARIALEIRGLPTERYREVFASGTLFHCEKGYGAFATSGTAFYTEEGELIEKFAGGGDHFRTFADAVKARKPELLTSDVLEGHLSTTLCHLANISHRRGAPATADALKDYPDPETLERMMEHLRENKLDPGKVPLTAGRPLVFDPATETFPGDDASNALLRREYRKPFVVPETV